MKKILVLGREGMAGHMIYDYLISLNKDYVEGTTIEDYDIDDIDDLGGLARYINREGFDIVINCIGLLIKACEKEPDKGIYINSYFPHFLEAITSYTETKIIHLSTDCVFDGEKGAYKETDATNGQGFYAKSKALGEIINDKDLTLRTSIIGTELKKDGSGLFEWFMRQEGEVNGYARHWWSGITTLELAKQIDKIIDTNLTGLYHLVRYPDISKFDLLKKIAKIFNKEIVIKADGRNRVDKSLINTRKKDYDPQIPNYEVQLQELKDWINR
jgi:dTDP-4-dehydrorhamnose reductase